MCQECGCSKPGPYTVDGKPTGGHVHILPDGSVVTHEDHHGHDRRVLALHADILSGNDRAAERNRGAFKALGVLAINVLSSPGAGKTTLLSRTINDMAGNMRCGVVVGDLATDNDAVRLRATGAPVVQIATGTLCHLEAGMVAEAIKQLDLKLLALLIIENVGNLVCPASFDLGEAIRVVLLSVTEGEDKPLKYPPMFHSADVVIVTKMDLAAATDFNRDLALKNIRQAAPHAKIFEVSSRSGEGMKEWIDYLVATKNSMAD